MKHLMSLAGLSVAGLMLVSCNTQLSGYPVTAGNLGNGTGCSVHFVGRYKDYVSRR